MSFSSFKSNLQQIQVLQRSLKQGRLAHAYLFYGHNMTDLEDVARTLAQTLNCHSPLQTLDSKLPVDCCDRCKNCLRISQNNHPDVHWIRPESKSRIITIDQIRDLLQNLHLKPLEAIHKFAIVIAAERLNPQAANAFLKTLEEPPDKSCILLLSLRPQELLETILSRCLRLNFSGEATGQIQASHLEWLTSFATVASGKQSTLLDRYGLLGTLTSHLAKIKGQIEEELKSNSSLERYSDIEPALKEKWEDELTAAIEAEYRRQRADVFSLLLSWFRDIWIIRQDSPEPSLLLPQFAAVSRTIAQRITNLQAIDNVKTLERAVALLDTNVQEALVLEVTLIKLSF